MPVSKQSIVAMAKAVGLDESVLWAAMEADEDVDVALPEVAVFRVSEGARVFSAAELAARDAERYRDGKTTGVEMEIKEYKKANGLDFKGKGLRDLAEHLAMNKEDVRVVESLRSNITKLERERDEAVTRMAETARQGRLLAAVEPTNNGLSGAKVLALMGVDGYEFREEQGVISAFLNGAKVRDERLQMDLGYEEVIRAYQVANRLIGDPDDNAGGRVGGGGTGSTGKARPKFTRASEVMADFENTHGKGSAMGTEHDYGGHLAKVMRDMEEAGSPLLMD